MDEPPLLTDLQKFALSTGRMVSFRPMPTRRRRTATDCTSLVDAASCFERWVLPQDAAVDLALLARWN